MLLQFLNWYSILPILSLTFSLLVLNFHLQSFYFHWLQPMLTLFFTSSLSWEPGVSVKQLGTWVVLRWSWTTDTWEIEKKKPKKLLITKENICERITKTIWINDQGKLSELIIIFDLFHFRSATCGRSSILWYIISSYDQHPWPSLKYPCVYFIWRIHLYMGLFYEITFTWAWWIDVQAFTHRAFKWLIWKLKPKSKQRPFRQGNIL